MLGLHLIFKGIFNEKRKAIAFPFIPFNLFIFEFDGVSLPSLTELETQDVFVAILEGIGSFEIAACLFKIFAEDVGTELPNS